MDPTREREEADILREINDADLVPRIQIGLGPCSSSATEIKDHTTHNPILFREYSIVFQEFFLGSIGKGRVSASFGISRTRVPSGA